MKKIIASKINIISDKILNDKAAFSLNLFLKDLKKLVLLSTSATLENPLMFIILEWLTIEEIRDLGSVSKKLKQNSDVFLTIPLYQLGLERSTSLSQNEKENILENKDKLMFFKNTLNSYNKSFQTKYNLDLLLTHLGVNATLSLELKDILDFFHNYYQGVDNTTKFKHFSYTLREKIKKEIKSKDKRLAFAPDSNYTLGVFCSILDWALTNEIQYVDLQHLKKGSELSDFEAIALGNALKRLNSGNSLKKIDLSGNKIGKVGAEYIAKAIATNPHLKKLESLNLSGNEIGDEGAKYVTKAIAGNPFLNQLESLDLRNNNIDNIGAKYIAYEIAKNQSLEFPKGLNLDLSSNNIDNIGALFLSISFLKKDLGITLDIEGNRIQSSGNPTTKEALELLDQVLEDKEG